MRTSIRIPPFDFHMTDNVTWQALDKRYSFRATGQQRRRRYPQRVCVIVEHNIGADGPRSAAALGVKLALEQCIQS